MSIEWDKCISGETVLVRGSGLRELFLFKDNEDVVVREMESGKASITQASNHSNSHIENNKIALSRLKEGVSILSTAIGEQYIFMRRSGDFLEMRTVGMGLRSGYYVDPATYANWTVISYGD